MVKVEILLLNLKNGYKVVKYKPQRSGHEELGVLVPCQCTLTT